MSLILWVGDKKKSLMSLILWVGDKKESLMSLILWVGDKSNREITQNSERWQEKFNVTYPIK
jgi:hypothetical protein